MIQEFPFCGPEQETCAANQTLEDEDCLVPCEGLYADLADDTLKQNMVSLEENTMKGLDILHLQYLIGQNQDSI